MHIDWVVALAGLIVGIAVGLTGMGGGSLMTPILVLLFGVQPLAAVSSDLVAALVMKPFGALVHISRHTVRWSLVLWLALGSVPAAFSGVLFLRSLGNTAVVESFVQMALGSVLLIAVIGVLVRMLLERSRGDRGRDRDNITRVRPVASLAIGAVVGFVLGITSTGSGTLIIVALLMLHPRMRGAQMVGTDLVQAIPMVGSAALAHVLFGDFRFGLTLSILVGSIPGVVIGSLISARAATRFIRAAVCVVMLVSGLKLLNAPTIDLGIALLAGVLIAAGYWIMTRRAAAHVPQVEAP